MINNKAKFWGKGKGEDRVSLFCILNGDLDGYKATDDEKKKAKKLGLTDYFQLFDDDGILYYSGYMNLEEMYDNDLDEFTILDMATYDSGCTEIKMRDGNGKMQSV
tara:strand:+ start:993 stop:1310 length:318 start_codon:yes stop_codon:yes gene_type:complete